MCLLEKLVIAHAFSQFYRRPLIQIDKIIFNSWNWKGFVHVLVFSVTALHEFMRNIVFYIFAISRDFGCEASSVTVCNNWHRKPKVKNTSIQNITLKGQPSESLLLSKTISKMLSKKLDSWHKSKLSESSMYSQWSQNTIHVCTYKTFKDSHTAQHNL